MLNDFNVRSIPKLRLWSFIAIFQRLIIDLSLPVCSVSRMRYPAIHFPLSCPMISFAIAKSGWPGLDRLAKTPLCLGLDIDLCVIF